MHRGEGDNNGQIFSLLTYFIYLFITPAGNVQGKDKSNEVISGRY